MTDWSWWDSTSSCNRLGYNGLSLSSYYGLNSTHMEGKTMNYQVVKENARYIFRVIAPCIDESDLHVDIDKDKITVIRDARTDEGNVQNGNLGFDLFDKSKLEIGLINYNVNWRKAECNYKNGVMTITIPRKSPGISLFG